MNDIAYDSSTHFYTIRNTINGTDVMITDRNMSKISALLPKIHTQKDYVAIEEIYDKCTYRNKGYLVTFADSQGLPITQRLNSLNEVIEYINEK